MNNELFTLKEIAVFLKVSEKTIYNMIKAGKIRYVKIGKQYRFDKNNLDLEILSSAVANDEKNVQNVSSAGLSQPVTPAFLEELKKIPSVLQKRLLFMAHLTQACETYGIKPIVVGGNAVEFYSFGDYATSDIDVISSSDVLNKILTLWDFKKEERYWYRDDLEIAIESPGVDLAGDLQRISRIRVQGMSVYIIGIEDLIIDRLNAYVHWSSEEDGHWTKELILLNRDNVDWKYLKKRAKEEKTLAELENLIGEI